MAISTFKFKLKSSVQPPEFPNCMQHDHCFFPLEFISCEQRKYSISISGS
jgi:hypothetical protein